MFKLSLWLGLLASVVFSFPEVEDCPRKLMQQSSRSFHFPRQENLWTEVFVSPNGRTAVIANDLMVRTYDLVAHSWGPDLKDAAGIPLNVVFTPDEMQVALLYEDISFGNDKVGFVLRSNGLSDGGAWPARKFDTDISLAPMVQNDGSTVAVKQGGVATLWDTIWGRPVESLGLLPELTSSWWFSPSQDYFAYFHHGEEGPQFRVKQIASGVTLYEANSTWVGVAEFSPDSRYFVVQCEAGFVIVNLITGKSHLLPEILNSDPQKILFQSTRLVVVSDTEVVLWDLRQEKLLGIIKTSSSLPLLSVAVSKTKLATAMSSKLVILFDLDTLVPVAQLQLQYPEESFDLRAFDRFVFTSEDQRLLMRTTLRGKPGVASWNCSNCKITDGASWHDSEGKWKITRKKLPAKIFNGHSLQVAVQETEAPTR